MIRFYFFSFVIVALQINIAVANRFLHMKSLSVNCVDFYKFYDCNAFQFGTNSYSGFICMKEKEQGVNEKIFKENFGNSGDVFDWTINNIRNMSYITMLPVLKDSIVEPLLLNSAFLTMALENKIYMKDSIHHESSSLNFVKDKPQDPDVCAFLKKNPSVTLNSHDIITLIRQKPDENFYDRMDCERFPEKAIDEVIVGDNKSYKKIIAYEKKENSVISFPVLAMGIYSYCMNQDTAGIYNKELANIHIRDMEPGFNMKKNVDIIRRKLKGDIDSRDKKQFSEEELELRDNPNFYEDDVDGIHSECLLSSLLAWPTPP